jgi:hypothetical protein
MPKRHEHGSTSRNASQSNALQPRMADAPRIVSESRRGTRVQGARHAHRLIPASAGPAGKAMFQMMGVFAEFERAMIQERVRAGLKRAVSEGQTLGRFSPRAGKTNPRRSEGPWPH